MTGADDVDDAPRRPREPDPDDSDLSSRQPAYNDQRDDYDEHFMRTPASVARERLFAPAVAFLVIGVLGILGMFVATVAAVVAFFDSRQNDEELVILLFLLWLVCVGLCLFALVIAGGLCMMRLRRHGLALAATFVVTGLSLAGPYAILFYPFGIWALILLYRPDIREQFGRYRPPPVDD